MQEGCLDFGVVRRGTDRHLMLPLRNLSDTPANVTLKVCACNYRNIHIYYRIGS